MQTATESMTFFCWLDRTISNSTTINVHIMKTKTQLKSCKDGDLKNLTIIGRPFFQITVRMISFSKTILASLKVK